jgi:hypothetical protein
MFSPKESLGVTVSSTPTAPALSEELILEKKIETELRGKFIPSGFEEDILDDFERRGLDALRVKLHEIKTSLTSMGYLLDVRYCTSKLLDHPVPVLYVKDAEGHFCLPSFNIWWDPTIPREFEGSSGSGEPKRVLTVDDTEEFDAAAWGDELVSTRLHVELFCENSPVALLVVPSDSANTPIALKPLFSRTALCEACKHGADTVVSGDQTRYAYVFHEVLAPAVGECIREESPLFGERETATYRDGASSEGGSVISFTALYQGDLEQLHMEGRIVENGLSLEAKLVVR